MNKYIWLGFLSVLVLTGCGESKEEEEERKAKEFWTYTYDDPKDRTKREKLYMECHKKTVRDLLEINAEARRISGNNNAASNAFQTAVRPMKRERDVALAKCLEIRTGK